MPVSSRTLSNFGTGYEYVALLPNSSPNVLMLLLLLQTVTGYFNQSPTLNSNAVLTALLPNTLQSQLNCVFTLPFTVLLTSYLSRCDITAA